jgi:hypothetical protein
MGEVFKHMGRPTCIVKSAYSRGEREEDLELAAALGDRRKVLASGLSSAQCAAAQVLQRGVNGQRGGARLDSLKHALKKDMSQVRMAFSVERARPRPDAPRRACPHGHDGRGAGTWAPAARRRGRGGSDPRGPIGSRSFGAFF